MNSDKKSPDTFERSNDQIGFVSQFWLRLALPLSLFQPNPRAPTILVDELELNW